MGRTVNMFGIMVILVAALIQSSSAQTTHVVGDALGWTFPPTTDTYSTWASTKTFTVGDTLVFNFTAGVHDVAEVTSTNFDSCGANAPIFLSTTTPTSINLNTTGTRYYICTFATHCSAGGQKVAISVSAAATSPAPQPSPATPPPTPTPTTTPSPPPTPSTTPTPSPSPVSTPSPSPSNSPTSMPSPAPSPTASSETYVVGDDMGWVVPPSGAVAYETWAADKTFRVGDILEFIFTTGAHTVGEVSTRTAFNSCEITAANDVLATSPARITLNATGEHFFICTIPTHCTLGQKLAINVTTGTATPPSGTATPPSGTATPPPSGTVAPPPPNGSGPSLASAALPITLLSIAMALFY